MPHAMSHAFAALTPELVKRASRVRLLALDVDGVMTDGSLNYTGGAHEDKRFHVRDGLGIRLLKQAGIEVAIITGRQSPAVANRAEELGITPVIQGAEDKWTQLDTLLQTLSLSAADVAWCGDDLVDLEAIRRAGLGLTVADAPEYIRHYADYVTRSAGGHGAVREICELILHARGEWMTILERFGADA